ncbi:hypothetical protein B0H63DRAFT_122681 [Podospora didyma]|uniref:Uncharacterized protein n=1 Tax=Podospora didyma TaxID=330526 RepID=A0AAE0NZS6_9PEZI|nr:hypothetical protein B0H63DRAFT_122681 [Podospora didyma]
MNQTKALGSLKRIFPSLHQPLPLSETESQRLLNALTTSFRAQLDKEHGNTYDLRKSKIPSPPLTYLPSTPAPSHSKDVSFRPTESHLRAILSNPLFASSQAPTIQDVLPTLGYSGIVVGKQPKQVFEHAVSKGLMTVKRAHGFLLAVAREIRQSNFQTLSQGLSSSGAGLLVIQWLRASGLENNLSFLDDDNFTLNLMRFMVAEGLEPIAWTWMQRLVSEDTMGLKVGPRRARVHLADAIVAAKIQSGAELDDAMSVVLKLRDFMLHNKAPLRDMSRAWRHLAWRATVVSWEHTTPTPDVFEAFAAMERSIYSDWLPFHEHLDLLHPVAPNPAGAIKVLTDDKLQTDLRTSRARARRWGPEFVDVKFVEHITSLGLDTVRHLTRIGEFADAEKILQIIRTHFMPMDKPQLAV